ncbi:MAG TPA: hypothetical protein VKI19_01500 [Acidimicrobiales bacterium]|nr:hypothetical protein [Acidimicrobiales bacterium]
MQLVQRSGGVDQHVPVRTQTGEQVDLVHQRVVADHDRVGGGHRFVGADRVVGDPAVGDDRGAHPLRAEARESLGVEAVEEGGHRQHLGRRHHALAASAMNPYLEHSTPPEGVESMLHPRRARR